MDSIRKIFINGDEVVLDTENLGFSEATLDEYLEKEGGWIDYYGAKLAEAERELAQYELIVEEDELRYDNVYAKTFTALKSGEGGSDKFVEAQAKVNSAVVTIGEEVFKKKSKLIDLKYHVRMLQQHLRAWDKNHENAQNRGNTLRKEMERMHKDKFLAEDINNLVKEIDSNG